MGSAARVAGAAPYGKRLVMAQEVARAGTNGITVLPALLSELELRSCLVTIGAVGPFMNHGQFIEPFVASAR